MGASSFIARHVRLKSKLASISMGVGMCAVVIAMAVAGGFRSEIRDALAGLGGDISIQSARYGISTDEQIFYADSCLLGSIAAISGVDSVAGVVYRGGIIKGADCIQGALFKGIGQRQGVCIPERLAEILEIGEGDFIQCYFPGERLAVRKVQISGIYDGIYTNDGILTVFCDESFLRRTADLGEGDVSAVEVFFDKETRGDIRRSSMLGSFIGWKMFENRNGEPALLALDLQERYPQLFGWLELIDNNVTIILILMILVVAFNMATGLLICLFENMGTIGLLKSMGMRNAGIARIFLKSNARTMAVSMLWGNAVAILLCVIQSRWNVIGLNPANYFINHVPVSLDLWPLVLCNVIVFVSVMAVSCIPCAFISRIDPSRTLSAE